MGTTHFEFSESVENWRIHSEFQWTGQKKLRNFYYRQEKQKLEGVTAVVAITWWTPCRRSWTPVGHRNMQDPCTKTPYLTASQIFTKTVFVGGRHPPGVTCPLAHLYIPRRCTYHGEVSTVGRSKHLFGKIKWETLASETEKFSIGAQPRGEVQPNTDVGAHPWPKPGAMPPRFNSVVFSRNLWLIPKNSATFTKFSTTWGTARLWKRHSEICFVDSLQAPPR
jgi:hypothetical protein